MKSRPILFSAPMVRAIIDGSKTQTRRLFKPFCDCGEGFAENSAMTPEGWQVAGNSGLWSCRCCGPNDPIKCHYGCPGDRLWVKETFRLFDSSVECACYEECSCARSHGKPIYRATAEEMGGPWKPSIFMRREYSRINLEITGIRVERLNEISPADCDAEGIERTTSHTRDGAGCLARVSDYRNLWEKINGPGSWAANPWVWVISFQNDQGDGRRDGGPKLPES